MSLFQGPSRGVFGLIAREVAINYRTLGTLAFLSGLSNALVLAVINVAASNVSDTSTNNNTLYFCVVFAVVIAIYVVSQRWLMYQATDHVEDAIARLRMELVEKIRHSELNTIERIGKERIYTTISKEMQTVSQASQLFVIAGQAAILIFFTFIYIAWLSITAFLVFGVFMIAGAAVHQLRKAEVNFQLDRAFEKENALVLHLSDLLEGFKEVKLNEPRANELQERIGAESDVVTDARTRTQNLYSTDFVLSQVTFFAATGAMVFLVPVLSHVYPDVVIKVTTASLFVIGPISNLVGGIPIYSNANSAAENVLALERELEAEQQEFAEVAPITGFEEITLTGLYYQHPTVDDDAPFSVGPIDLTIKRGEVIFVTGGNGSGKTTLLMMLTGLYRSAAGTIEVDGRVIGNEELSAYRYLFSAVFSDFHLFKRIYGAAEYTQKDVLDWLRLLEMESKVQVRDNAFTTTDLSGGQRKRLAMISSMLEKRPIYVFDEWAADQDPHYRKKFYREVLPRLKEMGLTVIAITHDDAYFDAADVHIKMNEGKLERVETRA